VLFDVTVSIAIRVVCPSFKVLIKYSVFGSNPLPENVTVPPEYDAEIVPAASAVNELIDKHSNRVSIKVVIFLRISISPFTQ
jgi:hypothetical protein